MKPGDRGAAGLSLAPSPMMRLLIVLVLGASLCAGVVAQERPPGEQLKRMSAALRSLSYEGTLVYLHDSRLETLHVVHRVEDGQVHEQLVSLNGPVRTLTRAEGDVTCRLSGSKTISVPQTGVAGEVLHTRAVDPDALSEHYLVHPLGAARVAGRQADVVGIIPRDSLRYGYRFYLDTESGLPLKSDLMGEGAEPIEQIMFTSLDVLPSEQEPSVAPDDESRAPPAVRESPVADGGPWGFVELPPGFALTMRDQWRDTAGRPVEHFVLSDGLASVSVYVESDPQEGLDGGTRIGAVHAAGGRVSGHQVTVVGEVPADTVQAVLSGVRHLEAKRP